MPCVLEPSWVGRRVTVRRAVGRDTAGRPRFADVVGDLLALDDERGLVETRAGIVEVPRRLIAVAKLAPPSTRDELDLDAVAAQNLHPAETYELGGWVLRANSGFTRRANSALPLRQPGMPLPEALGRAHGWYAQRGLPLVIHVPVEARRLLDAALAELGWAAEARTHLLTGRVDMLRAPPSTAPPAVLAERPDDGWLGLYRGGGALPDVGRELLARHARVRFASIRVNGQVVAVGRGTVTEGWVHHDYHYRREP
jgi:hypothetical protein